MNKIRKLKSKKQCCGSMTFCCGSGYGSRRPKNILIRRIRIRNTAPDTIPWNWSGFQVAKIKYEQNLMEKESWQKMQKIDDEIHLAKEKSKTDAEFYKVKRYPRKVRALVRGTVLSFFQALWILAMLCGSDLFSDIPSVFKIATQTKTFSHKNNEARATKAHKIT